MPQNLKSWLRDRPNVDFGIDFGTLLASFFHCFFDFLIKCANHQNAFIHNSSVAWAHSKFKFFSSNFDQIFIHFLMPHSGTHFLSFWCDLVPKRSILGAPWRPAGPQMAPKIGQRAPKIAQVAPKSSARTKDGGIFSLTFWMCLTHRTTMYKSILVVGAYYEKSKNWLKNALAFFFFSFVGCIF